MDSDGKNVFELILVSYNKVIERLDCLENKIGMDKNKFDQFSSTLDEIVKKQNNLINIVEAIKNSEIISTPRELRKHSSQFEKNINSLNMTLFDEDLNFSTESIEEFKKKPKLSKKNNNEGDSKYKQKQSKKLVFENKGIETQSTVPKYEVKSTVNSNLKEPPTETLTQKTWIILIHFSQNRI